MNLPNDGFDDALLGRDLPAEVEEALSEAGRLRGTDPVGCMTQLMRAKRLAPEHPAVLIAFYRDHFYSHRFSAARDVARRAMPVAAHALGLPADWHRLPDVPLDGAKDDGPTRFLLFLLKGYAYLSLRMGDLQEGQTALDKLRHLDPGDCVGAAVLESVRVRSLVGEDDAPEYWPEMTPWERARIGAPVIVMPD